MERAFALTDEEFSRIWTLASALYAKGKGLEASLREATKVCALDLPELLRQAGGLSVARQGEVELRLVPREEDPRSFKLVISTPDDVADDGSAATAAQSGLHLTLIRGERE